MIFNFLENNSMKHLIPTEDVNKASISIIYSEDDIRRICKEHLQKKFGIKVKEVNFSLSIYGESSDGKSTTEFCFDIDKDALSNEEIEILEKANYHEGVFLEMVMENEFGNPRFVDIEVYIEYPNNVKFDIHLPIEIIKQK